MTLAEFAAVAKAVAIQAVNFVEDHDRRLAGGADFIEHRVDGLNLFLGLRMADIDDVQKQVRLDNFLERGFERFNEAVRQFADETHGVRQQHVLIRRQTQAARGGVQRGE